MPSDEQLTLLIVRLELFTVEQTTFTKNEWNLSIHHKSRHQLHKVHVSCLECLCLQPGNAGTNTNFRCFKYPKKSLLKSSRPKKYLPNFPTPKKPGIENFKPKNILRSSSSLKIQITPIPPPPPPSGLMTWCTYICYQKWNYLQPCWVRTHINNISLLMLILYFKCAYLLFYLQNTR